MILHKHQYAEQSPTIILVERGRHGDLTQLSRPYLVHLLNKILPLFFQGVVVELLCCPTSAGFDLDVRRARDDGQAFNSLSDPLCRL